MIYLGILLRTIAMETVSHIALRNCPKEVREEPGYMGDFAQKENHVVENQKIAANYKKQISQVNDFCELLCMRGCKSLSSLKLFLRYAS